MFSTDHSKFREINRIRTEHGERPLPVAYIICRSPRSGRRYRSYQYAGEGMPALVGRRLQAGWACTRRVLVAVDIDVHNPLGAGAWAEVDERPDDTYAQRRAKAQYIKDHVHLCYGAPEGCGTLLFARREA